MATLAFLPSVELEFSALEMGHAERASRLQSGVAEEIRHVARLLEELAETLVGDAHFLTHFVEKLQTFDLVIQCADESARVLDQMAAGVQPAEAIASVRLGVVQDRLRVATGLHI